MRLFSPRFEGSTVQRLNACLEWLRKELAKRRYAKLSDREAAEKIGTIDGVAVTEKMVRTAREMRS